MNAKQIEALLSERHADDVFVPECNLGSAWARCRRMDAWAMKKSWVNPMVWGYEIKVSRSDFLNDDKWHEYLPCCNEFYWVCPWGMISPQEVGEGAGLMYVTKTGNRIVRKVKAVRRDVQIPEEIFRYVLMSRAQIVSARDQLRNELPPRDYWRQWLETRDVDWKFGQMVGRAIGETVEKEIMATRSENERLIKRMAGYDRLIVAMKELGIDPEFPPDKRGLEYKLKKAREAVPSSLLYDLRSVQRTTASLEKALESLNENEDCAEGTQ